MKENHTNISLCAFSYQRMFHCDGGGHDGSDDVYDVRGVHDVRDVHDARDVRDVRGGHDVCRIHHCNRIHVPANVVKPFHLKEKMSHFFQ